MNPFKKRPGADCILLTVVWITIAASTMIWTLRDRTPPPWDPADHLTAAYDYFQPLAHADIAGFGREFFAEHHYYAPVVHLITGFFYFVIGPSRVSGIAVNLASLAVLLYAIYWIGGKLYGRDRPIAEGPDIDRNNNRHRFSASGLSAGAVAAVLATSYHFTAWLLHDAFLDYPLTAVVAASVALLINAGDFRSRRGAVWFGISAGVGLLTKQTFGFFLALPAFYCSIRVLISRDRRAILNLGLSGLICVAIAAIWYVPHINDVIEIYKINRQGAIDENEAPLFSFMSNVFYLHGLVSAQIQLVFGVLLALGLVYSLVRFRRQSIVIYLWIASGIAAFTCIANKDMRYTVPVLPAAALLSVCWAGTAANASASAGSSGGLWRSLRTVALLLILSWAAISFFNAQWPASGGGTHIDTPRFRWMVFARNYFGFDHTPLPDDWSVPDIIQATAAMGLVQAVSGRDSWPGLRPIAGAPHDQTQGNRDGLPRPTLGVVVNLPYLNPSSIALYARLLAPGRAGLPLINVDWLVNDFARPRMTNCDFILVRTGLDEAEWVSPMERYAEQEINSHPDRFVRMAGFHIPLRNAQAVLYKVRRL